VPLDDAKLRAALESIHAQPTEAEAMAVLDVARLAASIDKKSSVAELTMVVAISRVLGAMLGREDVPLSSAKIDEHRLFDISETLVPMGARELAYACAYLVMMGDLKITSEEQKLAAMLGDVLVIDPSRSGVLARQMEELARAAGA
jgi:hypothetical protein